MRIFRQFSKMNPGNLSHDFMVSLSMGHLKTFDSQKALTQGLIDQNLLKTPQVISAFNQVDRKYFGQKDVYLNKPLSLGQGQNMTDPLMHAVQIENLFQTIESQLNWQQNSEKSLTILDIGCGFGYISFLLQKICHQLQNNNQKFHIIGIDIQESFQQKIEQIQKKISIEKEVPLTFMTLSIFDFLNQKKKDSDKHYEQLEKITKDQTMINVGFAITEAEVDLFKLRFRNSVIVAPVYDNNIEQFLTVHQIKEGEIIDKKTIMKCMFQPGIQQINTQEEENVISNLKQGKMIQLNSDLKHIKAKIVQWQKDFQATQGKKPSLLDMKNNEEIFALLQKSQQLERDILKFAR